MQDKRIDRIIKVFEDQIEVVVTHERDIIAVLRHETDEIKSKDLGIGLLVEHNDIRENGRSLISAPANKEESGIVIFVWDAVVKYTSNFFTGIISYFSASNNDNNQLTANSQVNSSTDQQLMLVAKIDIFFRDLDIFIQNSAHSQVHSPVFNDIKKNEKNLKEFFTNVLQSNLNDPDYLKYKAAVMIYLNYGIPDESNEKELNNFLSFCSYFLDTVKTINSQNVGEALPEEEMQFFTKLERLSSIVYSCGDDDIVKKFNDILLYNSQLFYDLMKITHEFKKTLSNNKELHEPLIKVNNKKIIDFIKNSNPIDGNQFGAQQFIIEKQSKVDGSGSSSSSSSSTTGVA